MRVNIIIKLISLMVIGAVMAAPAAAWANSLIERIHLGDSNTRIQIKLSKPISFKVIQVEPQEFLVAFRSVDFPKEVQKSGVDGHVIQQVKINRLANQVVTLAFHANSNVRKISSNWSDESGDLVLECLLDSPPPASPEPAKKTSLKEEVPATPEPQKGPIVPAFPAKPLSAVAVQHGEDPDTSLTKLSEKKASQTSNEIKTGGLDDILIGIRGHECGQKSYIQEALGYCTKKNWEKAFEQINQRIDVTAQGDCQELLFFLRAYLNFKMNRLGRDSVYLDGVTFFQDAINYFPDSPFVPYAMLALGKTFKALKNIAEAKGYFKIILKDYPNHRIRAEALYELGRIYATENKSKQAIETLRQFLSKYPESRHAVSARKTLGKVLYESNEFKEALAVLTEVVATDSKSVFKDKELLLTIGNLHYQLGNYPEAREALIKTVNFYPNQTITPVLMTRIADTFRDTNQPEQADKIYQLVMETHPGTDGFAISAMRHASYLAKRNDKENVYHKIIDEFPDHPMAKLAKVKLADLQLQAGEYRGSINTLREMAAANLKDLKNEAIYVLESSFEAFLGRLCEKKAFTEILTAYERDKRLILRLDNPKIFEIVGTAFLEGHLYSQAAFVLKKAYKLTNHRTRPGSLYYRLGIAFQETEKTSQAKELFYAYLETVPKAHRKADVYLRMSEILANENAHQQAFDFLTQAYGQSRSNDEKVEILMRLSASLKTLGQLERIPPYLIDAINLLVDAKAPEFERVKGAYQMLGDTYLAISDFDMAVDAYTMALKFSEEQRPPGLLFSLAESYTMARAPEQARRILTEILGSGDEFWARVAQEKMNSLTLAAKLKQT